MADAALYPFLCAAAATLLALVVLFLLRPAMAVVPGGGTTAAIVAGVIGALACAALLALLGATLLVPRPMPPFTRARRVHERAAVLSAATDAIRHGCAAPVALRAAARLTTDALVRADAESLASALERGEAKSGGDLLGTLGSALFAASAPKGGGDAVLGAVADLTEAHAEASLPAAVMRAELLSLALAGLALLCAALAWMSAYTQPFGVST